jgi:hypothetical protein
VATAADIQTWSRDEVLVRLRRERPYRFIGQRLTLPAAIHLFQSPLLPPVATPAPRHYLGWLPSLPPLQVTTPKPKALSTPVEIIVPKKEEERPKPRKKQGLK